MHVVMVSARAVDNEIVLLATTGILSIGWITHLDIASAGANKSFEVAFVLTMWSTQVRDQPCGVVDEVDRRPRRKPIRL